MYFNTHSDVAEGVSLVLGMITAALVILASGFSIVFTVFSVACAAWDCLALVVHFVNRQLTLVRRVVSVEAIKQ